MAQATLLNGYHQFEGMTREEKLEYLNEIEHSPEKYFLLLEDQNDYETELKFQLNFFTRDNERLYKDAFATKSSAWIAMFQLWADVVDATVLIGIADAVRLKYWKRVSVVFTAKKAFPANKPFVIPKQKNAAADVKLSYFTSDDYKDPKVNNPEIRLNLSYFIRAQLRSVFWCPKRTPKGAILLPEKELVACALLCLAATNRYPGITHQQFVDDMHARILNALEISNEPSLETVQNFDKMVGNVAFDQKSASAAVIPPPSALDELLAELDSADEPPRESKYGPIPDDDPVVEKEMRIPETPPTSPVHALSQSHTDAKYDFIPSTYPFEVMRDSIPTLSQVSGATVMEDCTDCGRGSMGQCRCDRL